MKTKKNLIYADECYEIIGRAFEVYKMLGFGHRESFYQKSLAKELKENGIVFEEQVRYKLKYKEQELGIYVFDFLVFGKIIVEIKQKNYISDRDINQLYKYLKARSLKLGIIITFTSDGVRYKRIVNLK